MKLTKEKVCLWTFSEGILKHKTTLVESLTGLLSDTGSTPVASTMKSTIEMSWIYLYFVTIKTYLNLISFDSYKNIKKKLR